MHKPALHVWMLEDSSLTKVANRRYSVGLPTVFVVAMVVGVRDQVYKQVIVKRLAVVNEMSALLILCPDKTGSRTRG